MYICSVYTTKGIHTYEHNCICIYVVYTPPKVYTHMNKFLILYIDLSKWKAGKTICFKTTSNAHKNIAIMSSFSSFNGPHCKQLYSNPYIFKPVDLNFFKLWLCDQNSQFEISTVYDIMLQRYLNLKIRVWNKNSSL